MPEDSFPGGKVADKVESLQGRYPGLKAIGGEIRKRIRVSNNWTCEGESLRKK